MAMVIVKLIKLKIVFVKKTHTHISNLKPNFTIKRLEVIKTLSTVRIIIKAMKAILPTYILS